MGSLHSCNSIQGKDTEDGFVGHVSLRLGIPITNGLLIMDRGRSNRTTWLTDLRDFALICSAGETSALVVVLFPNLVFVALQHCASRRCDAAACTISDIRFKENLADLVRLQLMPSRTTPVGLHEYSPAPFLFVLCHVLSTPRAERGESCGWL